MAVEDDDSERDRKVYSTFIRMAFTPYAIHFKSPNYMREETLRRIDEKIVKETLRLTNSKAYIRNAIGNDLLFWEELTGMMRAAVTSLERRSFQQWDPSAVDYETTSSALIASAYKGLTKDLDRLNDLVAVVRNILTAGEVVQDTCAWSGFDKYMLKLVNCCVRVTARGYDGEAGSGDEEKWQMVVNAYKKLLITSLQFMNNFCARNERRKMLLWMALFDSGESMPNDHEGTDRDLEAIIDGSIEGDDALTAMNDERGAGDDQGRALFRRKYLDRASDLAVFSKDDDNKSSTSLEDDFWSESSMLPFAMFWKRSIQQIMEAEGKDSTAYTDPDVFDEIADAWVKLVPGERELWRSEMAASEFELKRRSMVRTSVGEVLALGKSDPAVVRMSEIEQQLFADLRQTFRSKFEHRRGRSKNDEKIRIPADYEEAHTMKTSAASAAKILDNGKADLTKRLAAYTSAQQAIQQKPDKDDQVEPVQAEDVASDKEDDYHESTEDGRGLLTDVPLILGPSEIEILPNLIMSGLVMNMATDPDDVEGQRLVDMHVLRSHLLLSQENGQNLLRELLIFVAAWDLREEELYFKFMVEITQSLLANGLIPYAYHCFRDSSKSRSKDIISPAQAVIMKLLTNIFRWRAEMYKTPISGIKAPPLTAVQIQVVNFLFTEFRRKIVPNTCALIYFQGRIHDNIAPPEDFPLNLWDMERMYEGVYQYLEFFAVLTEEQEWKDIMAEWEVANELVTILKELEDAIPKLNPGPQYSVASKTALDSAKAMPQVVDKPDSAKGHVNGSTLANAQAPGPVPPPKPKAEQSILMSEEYRAKQQKKMDEIRDAIAQMKKKNLPAEQKQSADALEDELSKLEVDTLKQPLANGDSNMQLPYPEEVQDEPSDFEWRNLKKLTVLVLSSLIWKNKTVQDQVRRFGGLETLVGCCRHDEHNPYIREHAIMCLRFAVEGNPENAGVIQNMAENFNRQLTDATGPLRGGSMTLPPERSSTSTQAALEVPPPSIPEVPREVLDTQGYETFMDGKGQVGLRRKDVLPSPAGTFGVAAHAKQSAQALKEAAQQVIQNAIAGTEKMGTTGPGKISTKQAAERAAALMQNVLQDLNVPEGLDRDSRDIIQRLNKAALQSAQLIELEREAAGRK